MNNKSLLPALISLGLLMAALITRNGDLAWMMMPFLAYLGIGILQTPAAEQLRFKAERSVVQNLASPEPAVDVRLSIQNQARVTVQLFMQESVQPGMRVTAGELSRRVELRPGETAGLSYTFTATRGQFSWKSIRAVVSDPLGLIESELLLPAAGLIQIRPQIKKFKAIPFRPRTTLHSPGSIPAGTGGSGTDFFGIREYHAGDALRRLDWRLAARHPHKFFVKEFEQEEIAEIGLILDARSGSDVRIAEQSLFETSLGAGASLAEMFLHQGHRVSLFVFGASELHVFPGYGKAQLQRILGCLSEARVGTESSALTSLDFIPIRMFPSHALIVILSPLSSADRSLFVRLRAYGYQVLLISPDPIAFAGPILAQDPAGRLAVRAARLERRLRLQEIARLQIAVIDWQPGTALFPLLRNALTHSRGRRE